jgi:hypothetical protein
VIIQNRDGSLVQEPSRKPIFDEANNQRSYYADLPFDLLDEQSRLIERIISFAFDTLGVRHLEMRVREAE